jgi:hypothetical protein
MAVRVLLLLCLALPARAAAAPILASSVQQRPGSERATIVITVRGDGPASFVMNVPPGWDVTRTHASTGLLTDDANPRGTPPSVVRWTGVVSDDAPALIWIELLALPGARPGWAAVVVGDETVWIRAPGEVAPDPRQARRVWLPIARGHQKSIS